MASARSVLLAFAAVCVVCACNALVGYDDLEKTPAGAGSSSTGGLDDDDDDDDDREAGGLTSSGSPGTSSSSGAPETGPVKRCDPNKPFGAPTVVQAFDGPPGDFSINARLSLDELEAFWVAGQNNLRSAKRTSRDAPWGPVGTITLSPKFILLNSISLNGNKIYYTPSGGGGTRVATRPSRDGAWSTGVTITEPANAGDVFYADGNDIAFFSAPKNGSTGETNLFQASFDGTTFGARMPVDGTDAAGVSEYLPIVNASLTNIYFVRGENTNARIFHARRDASDVPFNTPVEETVLRGADDSDTPTWVSDDDCVIYLQRDFLTHMAVRPL